ncbi:MAG: sensor histidine kinase [Sarcina sp.]
MEYLDNYEVKKSNKALIIVLVIFSGIMNLFFINNNHEVKKNYIKGQEEIVGNILSKRPELEQEVVTAILGEATDVNSNLGKNILSEYSYDENLSLDLFLKSISSSTKFISLNIFLLIITIIIIFLNYKSHVRIYEKLSKIERWVKVLSDKKTDFRISEIDDGEISKLFMSFNKVNSIISESLETVKKEKEFLINLLSDISHQLKTPLSSMILNNEILLEKDLERNKELKFLESNERQLERMKGLIENLLKLAKIDAGAIKFKNKNMSIIKTVEQAIDSLTELAAKEKIKIRIKSSISGKNIIHDSFWVQEAIMNVVKNSIEHSNKEGIVDINIIEENLFIRITIEDEGEGIIKEEVPFIFDRFFKSSKSKKKDSAGIGLNLAKTIIEAQNGEISVKSERGKGTKFEICFLK